MRDTDGYFDKERELRVSEGWGRWAAGRDDPEFLRMIAWAEYPLTAAYINRRVSGDEGLDWLGWVGRRYFPEPATLGLSLGCGSGNVERRALELGLASEMEAVDVSEQALSVAREAGAGLPVDYSRLDLDSDELIADRYDLVVSAAALHHVTNLEHCLAQVHRSLKHQGLFVLNEFVGPDRFQWPDWQLDAVNDAFSVLPERLRHNRMTGEWQDSVKRKPLANMIEADPSEAVRSSEIRELVGRFFEVLESVEIGGTLLHPLLEGIVGNFLEESDGDRALINALIALEESKLADGSVPSDFVVMVCRKRQPEVALEEAMSKGSVKMDIITRQEREILELDARLVEAEGKNRELAQALDEQGAELGRVQADRDLLERENVALKSRGPLKYARLLKGRLTRGRSASAGGQGNADG